MAGEIIYSVFVSSTYEDLREERAAVQKALLQLHCMPIGMELFGSADEETWEFIQRQIADCDYYVVLIAGRYGSTAPDGLSYTEKEYDYAREIKKPVLAFVHGNRGSISRDKTENEPEKRTKLEAFIEKVRRSPVSCFNAAHDLATQVTVSFVNLRERRPAVGFVRADQAPDLKKYADLLEENKQLRADLEKVSRQTETLFAHALETITIEATIHDSISGARWEPRTLACTWQEIFVAVAERSARSGEYLSGMLALVQRKLDLNPGYLVRIDNEVSNRIALRLIGWGLLHPGVRVLELTEYGRQQFVLMMD
jgi:hypothetical protein